ncbi:MAG: choice-of-anchor B family protein [Planctomycetota bacterium]|jgi:choice-of-anchor B domain-containing protein
MQIRFLLLPAAVLGVASLVIGHTDDPKVRDMEPAYQGPGYRAGDGGVAGGGGFTSQGMALMSWLTVPELSPSMTWASDCWGYTSPSGREYALIGLSDGTAFVEITDPGNADLIVVHWGPNSVWRDMKTYDHYAYVVSEAGEGIQVFDLSNIDNGGVPSPTTVLEGGSPASHNVAIDTTSGFLYRCGGAGNGLRIYDLADPANPVYVAEWPDRYVHDAQIHTYTSGPYAGKQIAFCCGGFNGGWGESGLDIVDVTDKDNIVLLARLQYDNAVYCHQGWLSPDEQYFYLDDELNEDDLGLTSTTHIIDVSDLENPVEAATFTNGLDAITHNLYVKGDTAYAANYSTGVRVFDITDRENPVERGYFDTRPEDDGTNFSGLWSVYPFFESGSVIGSDRQRGLFVWAEDDTAVTFSYPNGRPDLLNPEGDSILVAINASEGAILDGSASMTYSINGAPKTVSLADQGDGTYLATFPMIDCPDQVDYYFNVQSESGASWASPSDAPQSTFTAIAAYDFDLAFADDMETDPGWTVTNDPTLGDGAWDRGIPAGGGDRGDPAVDFDGSGQCWLTDNEDGNSDVDDGWTTLTSPMMDAGGSGEARLHYAYWYTNDFGQNGDEDTMLVEISNDDGASWVELEQILNSVGWNETEIVIDTVIVPTSQMRVRFTASDLGGGSVVEAGIDDVRVVYYECDDTPGVIGDVNGDGFVDVQDLVAVITAWGKCNGCVEDITGDGQVDVQDLILVITNWS